MSKKEVGKILFVCELDVDQCDVDLPIDVIKYNCIAHIMSLERCEVLGILTTMIGKQHSSTTTCTDEWRVRLAQGIGECTDKAKVWNVLRGMLIIQKIKNTK